MPDPTPPFILKEDRERFAEWLEYEAKRLLAIIHQLRRLGAPANVVKNYQDQADAARMIAHKLRGAPVHATE